MGDHVPQEQIDSARAYEALMVPALFGQWAPRVVDAARIRPAQRVLDVACGTGILAREGAVRAGAAGLVTGLDRSPAMLAVAAELAPAIAWRQGDAGALPFPDDSFDVVVSQFGLMFFSDRHQALREMRRVLAPGGRLAVAVWDAVDRIPAYAAVADLLERMAGRRAADALRAPFALGDRADLERLFRGAGVDPSEVRTIPGSGRFPSARAMVEADLRGWLPVMGVDLSDAQVDKILRESEEVLAPFVTADGTVCFETSAHIVAVE